MRQPYPCDSQQFASADERATVQVRDWKIEPIQLQIRPRSEQGTQPSSAAGNANRPPLHAVFNSLQEYTSIGRAADALKCDAAVSFNTSLHRRTNAATLPSTGAFKPVPDSVKRSDSQSQLRRHASEAAAASGVQAEGLPPPEGSGGGKASISFGGGGNGAHSNSPDRWFGRRHGNQPERPQLRNLSYSPASPQACPLSTMFCEGEESWRRVCPANDFPAAVRSLCSSQMVPSPAVGAAAQAQGSVRRHADEDQPLMLSARVSQTCCPFLHPLTQPAPLLSIIRHDRRVTNHLRPSFEQHREKEHLLCCRVRNSRSVHTAIGRPPCRHAMLPASPASAAVVGPRGRRLAPLAAVSLLPGTSSHWTGLRPGSASLLTRSAPLCQRLRSAMLSGRGVACRKHSTSRQLRTVRPVKLAVCSGVS